MKNTTRQFFLLLAVVVVFVAVVGGSNSSNAQSCYQYFNDKAKSEADQRKLLWEYKGTVVALSTCMATCKDQAQSDQAGCYIAACVGACFVVGFDNCAHFFNRLVTMSQTNKRLKTYGTRIGCEK